MKTNSGTPTKAREKLSFQRFFSQLIKEQDLFGHQVSLNFDGKGEQHKTLIGGLVSILVKVFLGLYVYLRVKQLIFKEDSNTVVDEIFEKTNMTELVPFSSLKMTPFFFFYKQLGGSVDIESDEFKRYLDVYFEVVHTDWYKPAAERTKT